MCVEINCVCGHEGVKRVVCLRGDCMMAEDSSAALTEFAWLLQAFKERLQGSVVLSYSWMPECFVGSPGVGAVLD